MTYLITLTLYLIILTLSYNYLHNFNFLSQLTDNYDSNYDLT